jgi:hypothetical protein
VAVGRNDGPAEGELNIIIAARPLGFRAMMFKELDIIIAGTPPFLRGCR